MPRVLASIRGHTHTVIDPPQGRALIFFFFFYQTIFDATARDKQKVPGQFGTGTHSLIGACDRQNILKANNAGAGIDPFSEETPANDKTLINEHVLQNVLDDQSKIKPQGFY